MRYLFTSASEPTAISLARVLSAEGHAVYAADEERICGTAPARYSSAYTCFYRLTPTFQLCQLWRSLRDDVDVIIPFHDLPHHVREKLERKGACVMGSPVFHNDRDFQDFVREDVVNAPGRSPSVVKVPAVFEVHSRREIVEILGQYPTTTFGLQPMLYWDEDDDEDTLVNLESPASSVGSVEEGEERDALVLSCTTLDDKTVDAVKALSISKRRPYRMIEVVQGGSLYEAHAFVNQGRIRTFVVTTRREGGTKKNFLIVAASQPLFDVLHQFTMQIVGAFNDRNSRSIRKRAGGLMTHLTLTFRIKEEVRPTGDLVRKITATSCSHAPHSSLVLLASITSHRHQLALAYALPPTPSKLFDVAMPVTLPTSRMHWGLYSIPSAARNVLRMLLSLAPLKWEWWSSLARSIMVCWVWGVVFQEEMWDCRDPGPALCLWIGMGGRCMADAICLRRIRISRGATTDKSASSSGPSTQYVKGLAASGSAASGKVH